MATAKVDRIWRSVPALAESLNAGVSHPTFTTHAIRHYVRFAERNGLAPHVRRICRKILIDENGFLEWIASRPRVVNDTAPEGYTVPNARLIARLDGVIDRGDGKWYARCPAHEDRSPSLSIHDTGERILIHCFAGCATEDVLAAVGLTFRDLYPDPWRASYAAATANRVRKFTDRMLRDADPLDIERRVLQIAAVDLRAGKTLSTEDRARVELARQRLETARRVAA